MGSQICRPTRGGPRGSGETYIDMQMYRHSNAYHLFTSADNVHTPSVASLVSDMQLNDAPILDVVLAQRCVPVVQLSAGEDQALPADRHTLKLL